MQLKKVKDVEVQGPILYDPHDVMYMSMNYNESNQTFKEHVRKNVK
jgi:hypothetical protein